MKKIDKYKSIWILLFIFFTIMPTFCYYTCVTCSVKEQTTIKGDKLLLLVLVLSKG